MIILIQIGGKKEHLKKFFNRPLFHIVQRLSLSGCQTSVKRLPFSWNNVQVHRFIKSFRFVVSEGPTLTAWPLQRAFSMNRSFWFKAEFSLLALHVLYVFYFKDVNGIHIVGFSRLETHQDPILSSSLWSDFD